MKPTTVFCTLENRRVPVLSVENRRPDQVVVRFLLSEVGEHLSLHRERDGSILFTHWSPDKQPSTWDAMRVQAARKCGYGNPERHGTYYSHRPIYDPAPDSRGDPLVGRLVDLSKARLPMKRKYLRLPYVELSAPAETAMLEIYFATPSAAREPTDPHIETSLGVLSFSLRLRELGGSVHAS